MPYSVYKLLATTTCIIYNECKFLNIKTYRYQFQKYNDPGFEIYIFKYTAF